MSGRRDRLGLLLPLPALLAVDPGAAQAQEPPAPAPAPAGTEPDEPHAAEPGTTPPGTTDESAPAELESESPPSPGQTPASTEPSTEPIAPPSWAEAPPTDDEVEVRALFQLGREAYAQGDYARAAEIFERAAALAPDLVPLLVDAAVMYRLAATAEQDPDAAAERCESTRRAVEAVAGHGNATQDQIDHALAQSLRADEHCDELLDAAYGPCLSVIEPCLSIIPGRRGCGSRRSESMAMLGSLMLLGLRSRRRRDAVERVADRLPPDVAAKLRRKGGDEADTGD